MWLSVARASPCCCPSLHHIKLFSPHRAIFFLKLSSLSNYRLCIGTSSCQLSIFFFVVSLKPSSLSSRLSQLKLSSLLSSKVSSVRSCKLSRYRLFPSSSRIIPLQVSSLASSSLFQATYCLSLSRCLSPGVISCKLLSLFQATYCASPGIPLQVSLHVSSLASYHLSPLSSLKFLLAIISFRLSFLFTQRQSYQNLS